MSEAIAREFVAARRARPPRSVDDLAGLGLERRHLERLRRVGLLDADTRLVITDVRPLDGRVMSDKSFALRVSFAAGGAARPRLASVLVSWAGEPFVVERLVRPPTHDAATSMFALGGRKGCRPVPPASTSTSLVRAAAKRASESLALCCPPIRSV
jgi:hypothetical protein